MEKTREHQIDLYMCFIDYKKAFDCVHHERLWVILRDMGVPVHVRVLLRRLYTNQEATVRTEFGETMRKHERRKSDAFDLWCCGRVQRVSWMERKTNILIIETIKPEWTLESKAALSYFGHVVRAGGMEDDVMFGRINGARKRGRQRWLDTLNGYSSGAIINNMRRDARDRAEWRGAATAVARGRMRHNGTR